MGTYSFGQRTVTQPPSSPNSIGPMRAGRGGAMPSILASFPCFGNRDFQQHPPMMGLTNHAATRAAPAAKPAADLGAHRFPRQREDHAAEPSPILYTLSADAFLEHALQVHAVV